ncbi:sodium/potassium-transporting ATPase subunit beta-2-like [Hyposmocoma kahamanoa]|uniref:sodium/potassium-transporting ATPase subunit beta-2-like n=1 Tax=Hyposmocoma kahamanoa TaxID=1477025 RepID=UPI000E6D8A42|nr:sodium/potassium-transporting ATPase subunit beta-2-like [Hyposmocoma kahamanoa]
MVADKPNGMVNYCRRPPHRPLVQRIQYFFYNPEERTILGRTPHRWGVIGLIYLVMYICIIIFFSLCMCGLMATIDDTIPYYTLADSVIGNNPGMGHRPVVAEDYGLIVYNATNRTQVQKYVNNIDQFLAPYNNKSLLVNGGSNQRECGDVKPPRKEVCAFNTSLLGPCNRENDYGYSNMTPCLIIKLNKIYDFTPIFYNDTNNLPPDMPPDIVQYINSTTLPQQRRKVWLSCNGERPEDNEHLGPLKYYPYPGLSEVYFPYDNTPGYLSPLVAVQLLRPRLPI